MAGSEVGLRLGGWALGTDSITHALVSALWLLSALLISSLVRALESTTRTLAWTGGKETSVDWIIATVLAEYKLKTTTPAATCTLCWALICTSCCQPGWRRSSTGPDTGRCNHSHTPLLAPPGHYHKWAGQTLFGEEEGKRSFKLHILVQNVCMRTFTMKTVSLQKQSQQTQ